MIKSFGSKGTEDIFHGTTSKESRKFPQNLLNVAFRKLDMINVAVQIVDLKVPPGNRLELLKGRLRRKYSIRINDQFRIVFVFVDSNAFDVEIMDYH